MVKDVVSFQYDSCSNNAVCFISFDCFFLYYSSYDGIIIFSNYSQKLLHERLFNKLRTICQCQNFSIILFDKVTYQQLYESIWFHVYIVYKHTGVQVFNFKEARHNSKEIFQYNIILVRDSWFIFTYLSLRQFLSSCFQ